MDPSDRPLAVVTGASSGIGLELAKLFAAHDHDVIVAAEDADIHAVAHGLRDSGVGADALGWGIGMACPHLSTAVLTVVSESDQELAGASVTTVQLTAAAAGAAVGGAIANLTGFSDPGGVVGAQNAAHVLYPVMLAAPLAAFALVRAFVRGRVARTGAAELAVDGM